MISIVLFGLQWRGCISEFGWNTHCEYFPVNRPRKSVFHTISFMVEEVEVVQSRNANNFCALPVTWAGCLLCGWVGTRQGPLGRRLLPTDKCEQVVLRTTLCHSLKAPCAVRTRAWLIVTNLGGEEYITISVVFHFLAASKKMSNFPSEDTSFSSVLWMKVLF